MTARTPHAMERLQLWRLIAYGLPGMPLAAATLPLYVYVPAYYAVDLGIGFGAVGGILFGMRIWDMVSDPLIGYLSDRTKGGFGRRRPWILAGVPVALMGGIALFLPPDGAGGLHLLWSSFLLYLGWTMVLLPYTAWGAELSGDYDERSRISGAREGFVILGTVAAAGLAAWHGGEDARGRSLEAVAYLLIVGLPLTVLFLVAVVPDRRVEVAPRKHDWRAGLRVLRRNRPFRRLMLAWVLNGIANGLPATLFLLYVEMNIRAPEQSGMLLFAYFLTAVAGIPVWLCIARRIGKHRAWCWAMVWASLWFAAAPFLGPGDVVAFLAVSIATGLALGADLALPPSLQADVVDVDTAETGRPRAGLFFALWGMATKASLALAVGIAFPLLAWSGLAADGTVALEGVPRSGATEEGIMMLALLYGAVPVAFKLVVVAVMWNFPIDRRAQEELRRTIDRRAGSDMQETAG